jgi:hypothetical protein
MGADFGTLDDLMEKHSRVLQTNPLYNVPATTQMIKPTQTIEFNPELKEILNSWKTDSNLMKALSNTISKTYKK